MTYSRNNPPKLWIPFVILILLFLILQALAFGLMIGWMVFDSYTPSEPVSSAIEKLMDCVSDEDCIYRYTEEMALNPKTIFLTVCLQAMLCYFLFWIFYKRPYKLKLGHFLNRNMTFFKRIGIGVLGGIAFIVISGLVLILTDFLVNFTLSLISDQYNIYETIVREYYVSTQEEVFHFNYSNIIDYVLLGLVTVVIAPLYEELLFRGTILGIFIKNDEMRNTGRKFSIIGMILSCFIFAIIHLDAAFFLPIFLGSFAFAIIYYKTKDLFTTIIAHAINNGFALVMTILKNKDLVPDYLQ